MFSVFDFLGDKSQLKPFKKVRNRTITTDMLFDLDISKSMKSFSILGQYRASSSYQHFLGRFHFNYIYGT